MNHFIQIHILFGQRSTQAGMLRVKELAYPSPSNHRTHKTPCRTTGHLEDIIGTAKQEGGFSQKQWTLRWNTRVSLNREEERDRQCCHHTPWKCNLSLGQDIQHGCHSTANLFLRNSAHNLKLNLNPQPTQSLFIKFDQTAISCGRVV